MSQTPRYYEPPCSREKIRMVPTTRCRPERSAVTVADPLGHSTPSWPPVTLSHSMPLGVFGAPLVLPSGCSVPSRPLTDFLATHIFLATQHLPAAQDLLAGDEELEPKP